MRKDGKLFGKISIIDVFVLLLVVVIALGVVYRFSDNTATSLTQSNTYHCVVKVEKVRPYTADALAKGGEVYDYTTKAYIGTIEGVTTEPASDGLNMEDGSYVLAPMEDRVNAYVTISFEGRENADGYYNAANTQIGVGSTMNMNAKWAQCTGHVSEVYLAK